MSSIAALPDDVVLARLRAGDADTFSAVVEGWSGSMLRVARTYVSSSESAQDVVQETWLRVLRSLGGFEGRSSLRTWIFRILVNTALARAKAERREVAWNAEPSAADPPHAVDPSRFHTKGPLIGHWKEFPAPWPTPEEQMLDREWLAVLKQGVNDLPPRQRAVILLRDVEGYTSQEVCTILSITATNQRVLLHRARAFTRARLEEHFGMSGRKREPAPSKGG